MLLGQGATVCEGERQGTENHCLREGAEGRGHVENSDFKELRRGNRGNKS